MSEDRLAILVLAPRRDSELAARVLGARGHACVRFDRGDALVAAIDETTGALLIAEEALSEAFAEQLVDALSRQPPWSDLPILLVAHQGRNHARFPQFAILGNVAVLTRPMAIDAIVSAAASALRARKRQFQVRDLLRSQHEDAQRKDEFLAMLAHELRNPLAPVRFAAHALATGELPPEGVRTTAALIGRQVAHMARIVDDLLDVSRVTRGKIVLERESVNLADVVRRIAEDHASTAAARGVAVRPRLPEGEVAVHGDRTRLKQILDNLLDNAIKFSPPGTEVVVDVAERDGHAILAVVDRGEGIAPDLLPRLFQPFQQADRSLDRRRGGLGLGLALVRALARLHGGEATAASEGPGRGSTFTVRLPRAASDRASVRPAPRRAPARGSLRVLIAEDNRDAAESLRMLLQLSGHLVAVAHTGPAAVDEARRFRPDVVLCDIGLPGMSGYEVARRLRREEGLETVRLIAVTGYGTDEDRDHAVAAGFDRHLRKPVEPGVLMDEFAGMLAARVAP